MSRLSEDLDDLPEAIVRAAVDGMMRWNDGLRLPSGEFASWLAIGAPLAAAEVLQEAGLEVVPRNSDRFRDRRLSELVGAVVLSQSGKTAETQLAMTHLQRVRPDVPVWLVTSDPTSPLAQRVRVDRLIDIGSGTERAYCATKSHVAMLAKLFALLGVDSRPVAERIADYFPALREKAHEMAGGVSRDFPSRGGYVIGGNPGAARHMALILTEMTGEIWRSEMPADFVHGPSQAAPGRVIVALHDFGADEGRLQQQCALMAGKAAIIHLAPPEHMDVRLASIYFGAAAGALVEGLTTAWRIDPDGVRAPKAVESLGGLTVDLEVRTGYTGPLSDRCH